MAWQKSFSEHSGHSDALTVQVIAQHLGHRTPAERLICLESVDSTNNYLKSLARDGAPDGTVVISEHQTAGRGRLGRSFQSAAGKGIYLSALLRPNVPAERLSAVTALCAVAVCDAVEAVCGVRPGIKWVNDLVLREKKVGGILTELSMTPHGTVDYLVLGIGLNVSQQCEDFTGEVADMASSLSVQLGAPVSRPALAAAVIQALERLRAALLSGDTKPWLSAYRKDCITLGQTVQLIAADGSRQTAYALDIDEQFGLVIRKGNGEVTVVRSGEVSVRGLYGYLD